MWWHTVTLSSVEPWSSRDLITTDLICICSSKKQPMLLWRLHFNNRRRYILPQAQLVTAEPESSCQLDTCSAPGNVRHCRPKSFGDYEGSHFREFEISIVGLPVDKPDRGIMMSVTFFIKVWSRQYVTLRHWGRLGSFKLFKRPLPGFLTILTL